MKGLEVIYIIPIEPITLDLIEVLNDGIRPALADENTFFVYKGKGEYPEIINFDEVTELMNAHRPCDVNMLVANP